MERSICSPTARVVSCSSLRLDHRRSAAQAERMRTAVSSALSVRRLRAEDSAFVRGLAERAFGEYDPGAGRSVMRLTRSGITLVVCRGDTPLGFAIVHSADGVRADLCAIAVDEHSRGLGIGRLLLEQIESAAIKE